MNQWVGYDREVNRDVFCAALTGLCANPTIVDNNQGWDNKHIISLANDIALLFHKLQNKYL